MKNRIIHRCFNFLIFLGSMVLMFTSCENFDFPVDSSYARTFHPQTLAANSNDITATSAKLTWPIVPGVKTYVLELSRDSLLFENITSTIEINSDTIPSSADGISLTINSLFGNTVYSARVKTTSTAGLPDSKYIVLSFKTKAEQILSAINPSDKTSTSVSLKWLANSAVTHFMVTPAGGTAQKVDISADEKAAGKKVITGLTPATSYTFDIYNTDLNKRGSVSTSTFSNPPAAERIVWLTAADSLGIQNVMDTCTATSLTLVMPNGKYVFRTATDVAFTIKSSLKTVNFYAIPGTDTTRLKLKSSITLPNPCSITAITFENLKVTGYDPTADYCFNPSTITGTVSNISFTNCQIRDFRGIVRLRSSITVSNYKIMNCFVTNIRDYSVGTADSDNKPLLDNVDIENSTFYNIQVFIQSRYRNTSSVVVKNCTFYDMVNSGKYFFDFGTSSTVLFAPSVFTIDNCIFSSMRFVDNSGVKTYGNGVRSALAPTLTNCYRTIDFIFQSPTYAFSGLTDYADAASALFTNPSAGNFTIKDGSFAGISSAGDPRWRK